MRNRTIIIGLAFAFLGTISSSAFAQAVATMNQPDNGFDEGPAPEWDNLHSTDPEGTEGHRQYHRDAVILLNMWFERNREERGTPAYNDAHRIVLQDRNMAHRHFHSPPVNP